MCEAATPPIDADVLGYPCLLPNSTDIPKPDAVIPNCIKPILKFYSSIFDPRPNRLPPYTQTGPLINLVPGSKPTTSGVEE